MKLNKLKILESARKICVVRTDKLGDMALTLPLARAIKLKYPDCELSVLASKYAEPLLENNPFVDVAYYLEDYPEGAKSVFKKNKFDAVFFPRPRLNESFYAFTSGAPIRIGTAYRYYSFLYNARVFDKRKTGSLHEAEYNVRLLGETIGEKCDVKLVRPFISDDVLAAAKELLCAHGLTGEDYFIVHPGSGGSAREWGPKNFGLAGAIISRETELKALVTGISSEFESCARVAELVPNSVNISGKVDLRTLIAIISLSKGICANSTGTIHIAASLDVPCAGVYPGTSHLSPRRWGPYTKKSFTTTPALDGGDPDDLSRVDYKYFAENAARLFNYYK